MIQTALIFETEDKQGKKIPTNPYHAANGKFTDKVTAEIAKVKKNAKIWKHNAEYYQSMFKGQITLIRAQAEEIQRLKKLIRL